MALERHKKPRLNDFLIVWLWPIFASLFSFLIQANTLVSTLLFFGVPSLYLSFKHKHCVKMIFLFSFTFSIPFAIILDYIMEITQGWYIPSSFFDPYRILGYVSIEQLIWLFLYLYLVAIFYEAFLEKTCTHRLYSSHLKYGIILLYLIFGLFIIIHLTKHELLEINYFYLKFGIVLGLLPIAVALIKFPRLYTQFLQTAAYFFYLSFLYEVTALVLGQWTFPATNQFVGFLSLGSISFPFEELFFWIILGAMGALSYYKLLGEKG